MFDVLARLKQLRETRNWSVYKLAKLSGIPQSTIDKLEILCNTFGISLAEFFYSTSLESLDAEQASLLNQWNLLNPKQKKVILDTIDAFLSHVS